MARMNAAIATLTVEPLWARARAMFARAAAAIGRPAAIAAIATLGERLRREIITGKLTNDLVDLMGSPFVSRLVRDTGKSTEEVVRAWLVASRLSDHRALVTQMGAQRTAVSEISGVLGERCGDLDLGERRPQLLPLVARLRGGRGVDAADALGGGEHGAHLGVSDAGGHQRIRVLPQAHHERGAGLEHAQLHQRGGVEVDERHALPPHAAEQARQRILGGLRLRQAGDGAGTGGRSDQALGLQAREQVCGLHAGQAGDRHPAIRDHDRLAFLGGVDSLGEVLAQLRH